jgi:hypothetical protein
MTTAVVAFPPVRLLLDEAALCGWLGQAEPGDVLEYHRGFLAVDADPTAERMPADRRCALQAVARRALWAAERELAHLVQVRLGPEAFSYRMVVRPHPHKATSLSALLTKEAA